jgi:hypothetical protein
MMKHLMIGVSLATLAVSTPALANMNDVFYLNCSGFNQRFGYAGTNPPTSARVTHQSKGRWAVTYYLQTGQVVYREKQYVMSDISNLNRTAWSSWRNDKQIVGEIRFFQINICYMWQRYQIKTIVCYQTIRLIVV